MDVSLQKMTFRKYFIAIIIPDPLFGKVEAIKRDLYEKYGLKGALRSPSHITLHRPFEWKGIKETLLINTLNEFKFEQDFEIKINDYGFFEPRVIYAHVVPNVTLNDLHAKLTHFSKRELKLFNEAEDLRGFHPHVTLAFRDLKKPLFYELQSVFEQKKLEGRFSYVGFSLLKLEKKWEVLHDFPR